MSRPVSCAQVTHIFGLLAKPDIDVLSEIGHNPRMRDLARTPKQIGNLIRRARKQREWSQTQLGEKAGLRQETISLIESGNPATKLETILAVLAALDLEFLIGPRSKGGAAAIEDIF
jgi:HTH-type transcriptional regulator/antitoxin HipB